MSRQVYGAQCSIVFDLDFDDLVDELDMDVDEIREAWGNGKLPELITDNLSLAQVVGLSQDPFAYGGLKVDSGKTAAS